MDPFNRERGTGADSRTASDDEDVYVTGNFDNWSKSNRLEKTAHGTLEKTVSLPMSEKISYKVLPLSPVCGLPPVCPVVVISPA